MNLSWSRMLTYIKESNEQFNTVQDNTKLKDKERQQLKDRFSVSLNIELASFFKSIYLF